MEAFLDPLLPLFERERAAGRALALGVLVRTAGSTYRKPGALIVIAAGGEYAGLLSGGCLEGDLREHARAVITSGEARPVRYDLRGEDDLLWGLGIGCEGDMQILLLRAGPDNAWQPLTHLAAALGRHVATAVGIVVESTHPHVPRGALALPGAPPSSGSAELAAPVVQAALAQCAADGGTRWVQAAGGIELFVLPLSLPPRILLLGAGPDAVPVADLAARLNWRVTLADHRAAYAVAAHFPQAERVVRVNPASLAEVLDLPQFSAAVIMSHHLVSDLAYLRSLARTRIGYVGLLGPAARRDRLFAQLAEDEAHALRPRLRAPVGLALGGRAPESVALAIVAQLHAYLHASPELSSKS
jgi:xanthine/CO dehydrogenase XdhC/CoxF family maturation factor